jgi:uncharacterized protein involved in type VI secretion and phage assembly
MMPVYIETEEMLHSREPKGYGGRFYGAYPALVLDVVDPDGVGKVKVSLPWSPDSSGASYSAWARMATMMAGNNQGSWFIPDVGVEVLLIFLGGDPRQPCVIGALWNGQDSPPQSMDSAGQNNVKKLRSRTGVAITMDDTQGSQMLKLETPGGQSITLQDGTFQDSNGNSVTLNSSGISVDTSAQTSISASQHQVTAGMVTVNAGMSTFNGVTITNSIVSASYTPGAGNIW